MKKLFCLLLLFSAQITIAAPGDSIKLKMYQTYSISPGITNGVQYQAGSSNVVEIDREEGFYIKGTGQVPEYNRILPPHPENIPYYPNPTKTVVPFDSYYDRNIKGERRQEYMTPVIPNHNAYYSERRAYPYTKEQYLDVWCSGEKHVKGVDCVENGYGITFTKAENWTFAFMRAGFKARRLKLKPAVFIMVDDLGLDAEAMHEAKQCADAFGLTIWFGTINSYIPHDWIT